MVDVLIIGAGVTGSAIARELARTERSVLVLERELMCAKGPARPTAVLCMRDTTPNRAA